MLSALCILKIVALIPGLILPTSLPYPGLVLIVALSFQIVFFFFPFTLSLISRLEILEKGTGINSPLVMWW